MGISLLYLYLSTVDGVHQLHLIGFDGLVMMIATNPHGLVNNDGPGKVVLPHKTEEFDLHEQSQLSKTNPNRLNWLKHHCFITACVIWISMMSVKFEKQWWLSQFSSVNLHH